MDMAVRFNLATGTTSLELRLRSSNSTMMRSPSVVVPLKTRWGCPNLRRLVVHAEEESKAAIKDFTRVKRASRPSKIQ